jgi:hypothetical protein
MNGATNSAVPSALAMARLLGASSPKTTCKKVIVPKAAAKAMTWMVPSGTPSGSSSGWRKWAKAGSPIQPRPSEEIVMPSWLTER